MTTPKLIIHGGAGRGFRDESRKPRVRESLHGIAEKVWEMLLDGLSAREAVARGCAFLEDDPNFNAGTGSVLQKDGQVRMSAAIMDGQRQAFSGIINITRVRNPIRLADHLNDFPDRILSDRGALELARELGEDIYDPTTEKRLMEWIEERKKNFDTDMAGLVAEPDPEDMSESESESEPESESRSGTIGVVALDIHGNLAAGTSTGGRGFERIGRVSDTAMPAGNYASQNAAVSATGIGEDIIDECLAARICIRVTDGMSLHEAMEKSINEGVSRDRTFGCIGIDHQGRIAWGKSSQILLACYNDGDGFTDTLDLEKEPVVRSI